RGGGPGHPAAPGAGPGGPGGAGGADRALPHGQTRGGIGRGPGRPRVCRDRRDAVPRGPDRPGRRLHDRRPPGRGRAGAGRAAAGVGGAAPGRGAPGGGDAVTAILRRRTGIEKNSGAVIAAVWCALTLAGRALAYDEAVDSVMYQDPDPPRPGRVVVFPDKLLPLWLKALSRPEADMKRMAAANIIEAWRRGMPGLEAAV